MMEYTRCCVCMENFSYKLMPRNLSCGHSFCTACIKSIFDCDDTCPECRKCIDDDQIPDEMPINYSLLKLSQVYNFASANSELVPVPNMIITNPSSEPLESAGTCPIHGFSMFYACLRCCVFVCRGCLVTDHLDSPYGSCVIADIKKAMERIKLMHQKTLKLYLEQAEKLRNDLVHIVRGLTTVMKWFGKDMNSRESENVRGAVEILCKDREEAELQIPILKEIIELLQQTTKEMDEASQYEIIMAAHAKCLSSESVFETHMKKQREWEMQMFFQPFLKGKKNIKELVEAGKPVYATLTEDDGKNRWSQLVSKGNRILLYSLRDGIPPEDGVKLPFEVVRAMVPENSPWVFLDVEWENEYRGCTFIQMYGDTQRGRQTLLLCSGERGPSYRNTPLLNPPELKEPEYITGGDYETNDGCESRAIVDDIVDDERETRELESGMLVGYPAEEQSRLASFKVYLYYYIDIRLSHAFGVVMEGLNYLRHIRRQRETPPDILKSKVRDCGLVIPY